MPSLSTATAAVSFVFSVFALWLGCYIVTRDPRSRTAWLAGFTLWGISYYLAGVMIFAQSLPIGAFTGSWWGMGLIWIVPTINHMTCSMIHSGAPGWQRWLTPLLYVLAGVFMVLEMFTPWIHIQVYRPLLTHADFQVGPLYPLFLLYLSAAPILATYNLYYGLRRETRPLLRRQYQYLTASASFALFTAAYGAIAAVPGVQAPILITVLGLGGSIVAIGLGVAHFNALVEGRLTGRELWYTGLAIGSVALFFVAVAWVSSILFNTSFAFFIFVILAAVGSHALYDWVRTWLDRLFFQQRYGQIRLDVREILRDAYSEASLQERLETSLEVFCRSLTATGGSVVVVGNSFDELAHWQMDVAPDVVGKAFLTATATNPGDLTDTLILSEEDRVPGIPSVGLVAPVIWEEKQIGVMLLGDKESGLTYFDEELSLIDAYCESVAALIHLEKLENERVEQVNKLLDELHAMEEARHKEMRQALATGEEAVLQGLTRQQMIELVTDCLRNFHDIGFLGEQKLTQLKIVAAAVETDDHEPVTHLDRGRALQKVMVHAIEKLRPMSEPADPPSRDWYQYIILRDCYVDGRLNREVMADLYVSDSTFHRSRRKAIRGVAQALHDMEAALPI